MANVTPKWEEIAEFPELIEKIIAKYPERFSQIDPQWFIAYGCVNKDRPGKDKSKMPYELTGETEPESFTNTKKYFIKVYMNDWQLKSSESKAAIVFAALSRLDRENPDNGKVGSLNYKDQDVMVRTFGADWHLRDKMPNLLNDDVRIIDEPVGSNLD